MTEEEATTRVIPIVTVIALFFVGFITFVFSSASDITPENIVKVVNQERISYGLQPVKANKDLESAAVSKSADMLLKNYFDHYAFGQTPWMFILSSGYQYSIAGENLAKGFKTSEAVVDAWMSSPAHRANILNPEYEDIGVGVVKGSYTENGVAEDTTLTTEMMASPKPVITRIIETITSAITNIFR